MDDDLKGALDRGDVAAAIETIDNEDASTRVLGAYHEAICYAYWERKDLDTVVALGQAAIVFGRDLSATGLAALKPVAYDVASFCWPGWDEPGVAVGQAAQTLGSEAAWLNLELAHKLVRPDAALAAAHWIVGAHALAAGNHESARSSFDQAASLAQRSGDLALRLLYEGYAAIASHDAFATDALAAMRDGPELVAQLETAARLYG